MKRMTRAERRRLRFQVLIGGLLIALVVAADAAGWLLRVEHSLADQRAQRCQFFLKQPQPLLHLDIDQTALDGIGAWPWDRQKMAAIVAELYEAGAKVVALDVIFPESKPEADEVLGRALASGGGSVVAVHLDPPGASRADSKFWQALHAELRNRPDLAPEAAQLRLANRGLHFDGPQSEYESRYTRARDDAIYQNIAARLADGLTDRDAVRAAVLPAVDAAAGSPVLRTFGQQFDRAVRSRELARFTRTAPPDAPPALPRAALNPPVLPVVQGASASGFVYVDHDDDGKVRAVPLWAEVDGRLLPQLGLVTACRMLGVSPEQVRLAPDAVVLPRDAAAGGDVVIPVYTRDFDKDRDVPYCMDVPLFGRGRWETMYDRPRHAQPAHHLSAWAAFRVTRTRDAIANNESVADRAILDVLRVTDPEAADGYEALAPSVRPRAAMGEQAAAAAAERVEELKLVPDRTPELTQAMDALARARDALSRLGIQDQRLRVQLAQERDFLAKSVKDRAVLIGWIATAEVDFVPTAVYPACPGVVVHGAIYNGIMSGEMWRQAPQGYTLGVTVLIGLLSTLAVARLSPAGGLFCVGGLLAAYAVTNGVLLFDRHNVVLGLVGPLAAGAAVWSGLTLARVITEIGERGRITRRFQSYVDPTLVEFVLEHPDRASFEGQEKEMTVVFTDLQGFTTLSEKLGVRTVRVLSKYMEAMVPVIRANNGYVNKFLGDGIMCFFGAPRENANHAADACAAVLDMRAALDRFNEDLVAQGLPTLKVRAGISTGTMVVGDAGPSFASDYTVLGDRVNLAARLESANKATGTATLVTARTVELAGDRFLFRPVAALQVVGKDESVMTYEVLCPLEAADDRQRSLAALTRRAVEAFQSKAFDACRAALDELERAFGPSKFVDLYRHQCDECVATPPADGWAGQISLKEK